LTLDVPAPDGFFVDDAATPAPRATCLRRRRTRGNVET